MSDSRNQIDRLIGKDADFLELVVRHLEGRLTPAQRKRLDDLVAASVDNRRIFVEICRHAYLMASRIGFDPVEATAAERETARPAADGAADRLPSRGGSGIGCYVPPAGLWPCLSSYAIAVVFCGLWLLAALLFAGAQPVQVAVAPPSPPGGKALGLVSWQAPPAAEDSAVIIGKITGMIDCRWTDPNTATAAGADVRLGRQYALESGLMEITYNTGARVILEGPAIYHADSREGGFLPFGKLTATIAKRTEGTDAKGRKSPSPSSSTAQLSGFRIVVPVVAVFDNLGQGAEFGVHAGNAGYTRVFVFQGKLALLQRFDQSKTLPLGEGQQFIAELGRSRIPTLMMAEQPPPRFVRRMSERATALSSGTSGARQSVEPPKAGNSVND